LEQPCVFAEPREIDISFKQFFRLDMTIVERVYEVQANVASNQIEARRAPAGKFPSILSLRQELFLSILLSNH
jgi:hypothetical protein